MTFSPFQLQEAILLGFGDTDRSSCCLESKELQCVKRIQDQLVGIPTSQMWDNLTVRKNSTSDGLYDIEIENS